MQLCGNSTRIAQNIHDIFMRVRKQLMYGLSPCTTDFQLFRPDDTYKEEDAGPLPWTLKQLEAILAAHSSMVAQYVQSLAPEVLNICCGQDVRSALIGKASAALMPGDTMDEALLGLLVRCSLNLRAACREMVLESADAFATHIESFCPEAAGPDDAADGIRVRCSTFMSLALRCHATEMLACGAFVLKLIPLLTLPA
jgi:hypothetical protein